MVQLALFQPDIPGNTGNLIRLCACLGVTLNIIEPAGFRLDDTALKRAGMDYFDLAAIRRHVHWAEFEDWRKAAGHRLVLMTTTAAKPYTQVEFARSDILLIGRESSGVPPYVHEAADIAALIPMAASARSINMAAAAAMTLGEALRQTDGFPLRPA